MISLRRSGTTIRRVLLALTLALTLPLSLNSPAQASPESQLALCAYGLTAYADVGGQFYTAQPGTCTRVDFPATPGPNITTINVLVWKFGKEYLQVARWEFDTNVGLGVDVLLDNSGKAIARRW